MKILLVSSAQVRVAAERFFLVYLAQGLADRGHEVMVWIPSHPRMDELADKCSRFAVSSVLITATPTITRLARSRLVSIERLRGELPENGKGCNPT